MNSFCSQCRVCKIKQLGGGVKARKYDDGSVSEWFDKQDNRIDGCWLYNFDTVEDFFESLANTIALWYAQCLDRPEPVSCICNVYVGKYSQARVDSVRRFADKDKTFNW